MAKTDIKIDDNNMSFVGSNLGCEGKEAYNLLSTNIL